VNDAHDLDQLMVVALTALELASHTAAASSDSGRIKHGKPGGNQPPYVSAPHLALRARYRRARTNQEREALLEEARAELRSIRYARRAPAHATKEHRLMIGTDPRPADDVAYVWGCSTGHVYRCRKEAQRAPEYVRQRAKLTGSQRQRHL
jgi:hypothetical protein